jgi:sulfite exporter TauE/SafE
LVTALVIGRWVASAAPYLAIAFGGLMSVYALRELVVAFRPTGASRRSGKLDRLAATLHRSILSLPLPRAVAFGLATALLPCGFLLTALLQASLFAHPAHAALGMMIFAVASSPALLAGSGLLAVIHRRAPRAGPMIAAILLLISSLVVVWRAIATPHDHHSHHDHSPTDQ